MACIFYGLNNLVLLERNSTLSICCESPVMGSYINVAVHQCSVVVLSVNKYIKNYFFTFGFDLSQMLKHIYMSQSTVNSAPLNKEKKPKKVLKPLNKTSNE